MLSTLQHSRGFILFFDMRLVYNLKPLNLLIILIQNYYFCLLKVLKFLAKYINYHVKNRCKIYLICFGDKKM